MFYKDRSRKDGLADKCKECSKIARRLYWFKRPDNYIKNKYPQTSDACKITKKKWYEANKHTAEFKEYRQKNDHNRRARKVGAFNDNTWIAKHIQELLYLQDNKCNYCLINISKWYHRDHIVPLALWWEHSIHNCQLLCAHCNTSKGAILK